MKYPPMKQVAHEDLLAFRKRIKKVTVGKQKIELSGPYTVKQLGPPGTYEPEDTTTWSFKSRGSWATHRGNYRGNWSPYIPYNLILRYSNEGDVVLDPMVGSGTTLIECRLLGRRGIGVDINRKSIMIARDRLDFDFTLSFETPLPLPIETYVGSACRLNAITSESVDLITMHPPYAGIIMYGSKKMKGDLSTLKFEEYIEEMRVVATEALRVLKPGGHCAVLIGDTRKYLHYIPISQRIMHAFWEAGFLLREDIIKHQWNMKGTRESWSGVQRSFYKIANEHLFVFRKPEANEATRKFKNSKKWWD